MILQISIEVTKKDIEDEIQEYEDLIETREEMNLYGVIKTAGGKKKT